MRQQLDFYAKSDLKPILKQLSSINYSNSLSMQENDEQIKDLKARLNECWEKLKLFESENEELKHQIVRFEDALHNSRNRYQVLKRGHLDLNNKYAQLGNEYKMVCGEIDTLKSTSCYSPVRPFVVENCIHSTPTTPRTRFLRTPRHSCSEMEVPKLRMEYSSIQSGSNYEADMFSYIEEDTASSPDDLFDDDDYDEMEELFKKGLVSAANPKKSDKRQKKNKNDHPIWSKYKMNRY